MKKQTIITKERKAEIQQEFRDSIIKKMYEIYDDKVKWIAESIRNVGNLVDSDLNNILVLVDLTEMLEIIVEEKKQIEQNILPPRRYCDDDIPF